MYVYIYFTGSGLREASLKQKENSRDPQNSRQATRHLSRALALSAPPAAATRCADSAFRAWPFGPALFPLSPGILASQPHLNSNLVFFAYNKYRPTF